MAPEVLAGEDVDGNDALERAADVYSFGVILYALEMARETTECSGCGGRATPPLSTDDRDWLKLDEDGLVSVPRCCDYYYGRLMKKCVAKNPLKRPSFDKIVDELIKLSK